MRHETKSKANDAIKMLLNYVSSYISLSDKDYTKGVSSNLANNSNSQGIKDKPLVVIEAVDTMTKRARKAFRAHTDM